MMATTSFMGCSRIGLSDSGGLSLALGASKHREDATQKLCHMRDY